MKQTLQLQTQCPSCSANWKEIENALYDNGSDDWYIALVVIKNCHTCQIRFSNIIERLKGE